MTTLRTKYNAGAFTMNFSVKVDEAQLVQMAEYGLKWLTQRNSNHDRILGCMELCADGKMRRKYKWTRGAIGYSDRLARELKESYEELSIEDGDNATPLGILAEIYEYVKDEQASVFKDERAKVAHHTLIGDLDKWAKEKIGYEDDTHDEDGEISEYFLRAIRDKVKELQAAALAAAGV